MKQGVTIAMELGRMTGWGLRTGTYHHPSNDLLYTVYRTFQQLAELCRAHVWAISPSGSRCILNDLSTRIFSWDQSLVPVRWAPQPCPHLICSEGPELRPTAVQVKPGIWSPSWVIISPVDFTSWSMIYGRFIQPLHGCSWSLTSKTQLVGVLSIFVLYFDEVKKKWFASRIMWLVSRMRSKGSRFTLGVWGLRVCSLDVAFVVATARNRSQPSATVPTNSL